jgi:hypothetical protein
MNEMNYMLHLMNEAGEDAFIFSETKDDLNIKDFEEVGFKVIGTFEIKLIDGVDDLPEISEPDDAEVEDGEEEVEESGEVTDAQFKEISGDVVEEEVEK